MHLSLFQYPFPKELVAQQPPKHRDEARMMVLNRAKKSWEHRLFSDLTDYLIKGDLLILNDAEADLISFQGKLVPPLPPYIKRKKVEEFTEEDYQRYRTVYARTPGSKAAPTAGFHFTDEILKWIVSIGVEIRTLTLHVDYDTYKPIRCQEIEDHPMHGERFEIPDETAQAIAQAKKEGRRIVAVGTTVVRALESAALGMRDFTRLFISPGFSFKVVDLLLTNFHRPRSTVLVLASAFAGREFLLKAYEEAIRERYRLFSYGDCMLMGI